MIGNPFVTNGYAGPDIYATNSLYDFVSVFGKSILDALKPKGQNDNV